MKFWANIPVAKGARQNELSFDLVGVLVFQFVDRLVGKATGAHDVFLDPARFVDAYVLDIQGWLERRSRRMDMEA